MAGSRISYSKTGLTNIVFINLMFVLGSEGRVWELKDVRQEREGSWKSGETVATLFFISAY